jgi:hypothetical protein
MKLQRIVVALGSVVFRHLLQIGVLLGRVLEQMLSIVGPPYLVKG